MKGSSSCFDNIYCNSYEYVFAVAHKDRSYTGINNTPRQKNLFQKEGLSFGPDVVFRQLILLKCR